MDNPKRFAKLRGRIVEKIGSQGALCQKLGWHHDKLSRKLNGRTGWTSRDVTAICEILDIPIAEAGEYFFEQKTA